MPQAALEVRGLTKYFPGVTALDDASLYVNDGEIVGLVGENGAGKSTLLNILSGTIGNWSGEALLRGESVRPRNYHEATLMGIARVFQEQALVPTLPVYENMFLSHESRFTRGGIFLDGRKMVALAEKELKILGIDINVRRPARDYDFSTRQAIEIAKAFGLSEMLGTGAPIILLDEPTAALPHREIAVFFSRLGQLRVRAATIFISHRLSEILEVCDRLYVLKDGKVVAEVLPNQIDEGRLHELMVGRKRDRDYYKEDEQRQPQPEPALEVSGLTRRHAFTDITLAVYPGEILGIGGVLGSGKSELGRTIAGVVPSHEGELRVAGRSVPSLSFQTMIKMGVGYVPQERHEEGIILHLSLALNLTLSSVDQLVGPIPGFLNLRREAKVVDEFVRILGVKASSPSTLADTLSGGNQQKIVLGKWLVRQPEVLILDSPTRGVDAGAKEDIYSILRNLATQGMAIILITDELLELIGMSNRILVMKDGRVTYTVAAPPDSKPSEQELVRHMV